MTASEPNLWAPTTELSCSDVRIEETLVPPSGLFGEKMRSACEPSTRPSPLGVAALLMFVRLH
jgi:hypothetical protein